MCSYERRSPEPWAETRVFLSLRFRRSTVRFGIGVGWRAA
jgi:hypothetical protein